MAMTEVDGWKYKGMFHDGEAYVCSSFVAAVWKAAGIFGDNYINAVEFSPKDVYQIDIFNKTWQPPQVCADADPEGATQGYCQLIGKYRLNFPGYSTIPLYAHMNDHCKSLAPDFIRPDSC